ncbi:PAS domain-containing hybrid sensor histidine kinase/response regulator [uncultured Endozoicomonas sp.]|uniref:PAS domain-containing hybrid sensor histidine kinase/response regulator n=1 Tax=uncultured Endozoicomonas sp. TaxID=432652 RepID=UPI0026389B52|nr:PAS domain-containing hybrid sensor histidine kinase/response regulator [uncultured Endozoicomonas sp.]
MSGWILALIATAYVAILFVAAWFGDYRGAAFRKRWQPYIYSLSLAVYCTSWTFFGAVGQASEELWSFIPIYLGPILVFVLFWKLLVKLITVSKQENITSIADFIASRHGRSHYMAILVTVVLVVGILPYIALQLKAMVMGFGQLTNDSWAGSEWSRDDLGLVITLTMAIFVIMFGTRKLDATEHQNGIMTAIALESLIKLSVFLLVGGWVTWKAVNQMDFSVTLSPQDSSASSNIFDTMLMPTIMAMAAILCLPRQFHVTVVENSRVEDFYKARWLFPAYLLLLTLLVVPLAQVGNQILGDTVPGDAYVIELPKAMGNMPMAVLAFLGGVSAAISMVIVATLALTTMVSNEILMPLLLWRNKQKFLRSPEDFYRFSGLLLTVRRTTIVCLLMMSWVVYRLLADSGSLASIGQMSFSAVTQLAPVLIGSLYLRDSNAKAATGGIIAGISIWFFCLVVPVLVDFGWLNHHLVTHGLFGQFWLKPSNLFGFELTETVSGTTLLALTLNCLIYLLGCLYLRPGLEEKKQSRKFVDAVLAEDGVFLDVVVTVGELEQLASRFVSKNRVLGVIQSYEPTGGGLFKNFDDKNKQAEPQLIAAIERLLAGTLGASSARIVMKSLVQGNVGLEEVQAMVEEASEVFQFNRELLQGAIEHISTGVSVVDRDLRLVAWNHQYLELFNYPPDLITVGRPIAEVIQHNARNGLCGAGSIESHVEKRLSFMRQGTAHRSERLRPDGRVIQIQGNPMPGGGFVMTFTDISEFRQVEEELKNVNERLEQRVRERTKALSLLNVQLLGAKSQAEKANNQRSRFFAAISHDLMQPMNAARLFTSSMEIEAKGTSLETLANNINNSLQSAEHLLTDLLDMSRIEAGKMTVSRRELPVSEVLDTLRAEFEWLAKDSGIVFRVHNSQSWICTDPVLLRRVLQNFLTNGFRYAGHYEAVGKIVIGCRHLNDGRLAIEVRDNGPGVPANKQKIIFSDFQRASSTGNGLGLGLSIARGISRILESPISLKSEPGKGAIFSIAVAKAQRTTVAKLPPSPTELARHLTLNVLCIDDEPEIAAGMSSLLSRWGCDVSIAHNDEQARQVLQEGHVDLLMVDYHLGLEIDGVELIEALRHESEYEMAAVLVTANQQDGIRQRCRTLDIAYLAKPVKPAAMRALLNSINNTVH